MKKYQLMNGFVESSCLEKEGIGREAAEDSGVNMATILLKETFKKVARKYPKISTDEFSLEYDWKVKIYGSFVTEYDTVIFYKGVPCASFEVKGSYIDSTMFKRYVAETTNLSKKYPNIETGIISLSVSVNGDMIAFYKEQGKEIPIINISGGKKRKTKATITEESYNAAIDKLTDVITRGLSRNSFI